MEMKKFIEEVEVILTQEDKAEILREYAVNGNNFREAFRAVRTKQNIFDEKIKEEIEVILMQDDCLELLIKYFLNRNDFKKAFKEARKAEEITIEENEIKLVAKEFDETTDKCIKYVVEGSEENYIEKYEYGWIVHFENKCYVKVYKYLKNAVKTLSDVLIKEKEEEKEEELTKLNEKIKKIKELNSEDEIFDLEQSLEDLLFDVKKISEKIIQKQLENKDNYII